MVVGVCKVSLMLPSSESLKDKRSVLRHIKDKVQHKFNCAIAEVADQDLLQSAELGFAVVSNELGFTQSVVQKILQYIEDLAAAKVTGDEQDYINYGEGSLEIGKDHWEPEQDAPMTAPRKPQKKRPPDAGSDDKLPDWLPQRFLETPDPDDGGKR
jgi:uncharacterized protein YlxP (DUF503 family)